MVDIFEMQADDYASLEDTTGFDGTLIAVDNADRHFGLMDQDGRICARCSIWCVKRS